MKHLKRLLRVGLLALSLLAVAVPVAFAQAVETDPIEQVDTNDGGFDWGLLGLLGLLGLAGLASRDRKDHDVRGVDRAPR